MQKVAVLLFPSFSEFEIGVAVSILSGRYTIETVAQSAAPVRSEAGLRLHPDVPLTAADPAHYEASLVPGGSDLRGAMEDPAVSAFLRGCGARGMLIGAICAGPMLLARAGLLDGRKYTTSLCREHRDALGCFDEAGFEAAPIVESGPIVTAQGWAYVEFAIHLAERLEAMQDADAVRAYYRGQGELRRAEPTPAGGR
jgi:protein deglycase